MRSRELILVNVPVLRDGASDRGGCGELELQLGTSGGLKVDHFHWVQPIRSAMTWLFIVALRPVAVHHEVAGNAEPGAIIRDQIKGVQSVFGHTHHSRQAKPVILRAFVASKFPMPGTEPTRQGSIPLTSSADRKLPSKYSY